MLPTLPRALACAYSHFTTCAFASLCTCFLLYHLCLCFPCALCFLLYQCACTYFTTRVCAFEFHLLSTCNWACLLVLHLPCASYFTTCALSHLPCASYFTTCACASCFTTFACAYCACAFHYALYFLLYHMCLCSVCLLLPTLPRVLVLHLSSASYLTIVLSTMLVVLSLYYMYVRVLLHNTTHMHLYLLMLVRIL